MCQVSLLLTVILIVCHRIVDGVPLIFSEEFFDAGGHCGGHGWFPLVDELSIEWSVAGVKCLVTLVELS